MLANKLYFLHEIKSLCRTTGDQLQHRTSLVTKGESSEAIKRHLARSSLKLKANKSTGASRDLRPRLFA
jgi:hypothetical protein